MVVSGRVFLIIRIFKIGILIWEFRFIVRVE